VQHCNVMLETEINSLKGDILDDYLRTDGVWILTRNKQFYETNNEKECAEKCEAERNFTCRAFLFTRKKLQCLTLAENAKMTVTFASTDTVLYEKIIYLMQCKRGIGTDYRGTEAKTQRGIPCQKWAEKIPHKPKYVPIYISFCCSETFPSFLIFIYIHKFVVQVVKSCCQVTFKNSFIFTCLVTFDSTAIIWIRKGCIVS
uniref:Uncharacterized protein n=1 Tax=Geospiza parvula TaxID=87175 RepID=A0A8C3QAW3_GEOPR